jgi:hypothetical protein
MSSRKKRKPRAMYDIRPTLQGDVHDRDEATWDGAVQVLKTKLTPWGVSEAVRRWMRRRVSEATTRDYRYWLRRHDPLLRKAADHFGITHDHREAGYILPTGHMLDFSGRHEMPNEYTKREDGTWRSSGRDYLAGQRVTDHHYVSDIGTDMESFMKAGAVRFHAQEGQVHFHSAKEPTPHQLRRLREVVGHGTTLSIDLEDGKRKAGLIWDGPSADAATGVAKRFYRGENFESGEVVGRPRSLGKSTTESRLDETKGDPFREDQGQHTSMENPILRQDHGPEGWLDSVRKHRIADAKTRGKRPPYLGEVTADFTAPLHLPASWLAKLPGYSGEHLRPPRPASTTYIHGALSKGKLPGGPPLVGVDVFGKHWVVEGNHRIREAARLGKTLPVEVRYFDGGDKHANPSPESLLRMHLPRGNRDEYQVESSGPAFPETYNPGFPEPALHHVEPSEYRNVKGERRWSFAWSGVRLGTNYDSRSDAHESWRDFLPKLRKAYANGELHSSDSVQQLFQKHDPAHHWGEGVTPPPGGPPPWRANESARATRAAVQLVERLVTTYTCPKCGSHSVTTSTWHEDTEMEETKTICNRCVYKGRPEEFAEETVDDGKPVDWGAKLAALRKRRGESADGPLMYRDVICRKGVPIFGSLVNGMDVWWDAEEKDTMGDGLWKQRLMSRNPDQMREAMAILEKSPLFVRWESEVMPAPVYEERYPFLSGKVLKAHAKRKNRNAQWMTPRPQKDIGKEKTARYQKKAAEETARFLARVDAFLAG